MANPKREQPVFGGPMKETTVVCPNCKKEFPLTQTIIGSLEDELRKEYDSCLEEREEELKRKETELDRSMKEFDDNLKVMMEKEKGRMKESIEKETQERFGLEMKDLQAKLDEKECRVQELEEEELKLRKKERELKDREKDMDRQIETMMEAEKQKMKEVLKKEAEESFSLEISDLGERLREKDNAIKQLQDQELQMRKRQRELEDKERDLKIEMERKLDEEKKGIEAKVTEKLQEQHHLKELEKEKTIKDLKDQIEIMKIKAEQGSQQLQGEVLELELEQDLSKNFPFDDVQEVKKGVRGADILQKVRTNTGFHCGTILWETKRAKDWSGKWVAKLKDDLKEAQADIAILCTTELPKEVDKFSISGDVVVTSTTYALPVATLIREQILRISRERNIMKDFSDKKDLLYTYLTGPQFRQSVEGIVDAFVEMKGDLDKERRSLEKHWAVREKQILRALSNLSSIYGSMQGLAGTSLPPIRNLEIDVIPERSSNGDDPSLDDY